MAPSDCISHFLQHGSLVRGKKLKKDRNLIWCVVVWNLWLLRNKIIFRSDVANYSYILTLIKVVFSDRQMLVEEV